MCAGPLAPLYYSGQFVPLIVFFLLFLAIVKNNKLHHFVRFNCMQVQPWLSHSMGRGSSLCLISRIAFGRVSCLHGIGSWACRPTAGVAAWQGVMLDIVSMLFTLLRAYVPAEVRWSFILDIYDMFSWNICMCTILYCVFFSLAYALLPDFSSVTIKRIPQVMTAHVFCYLSSICEGCRSRPLTIPGQSHAREWPLVWLRSNWIPCSQVLRCLRASTFFLGQTHLPLSSHAWEWMRRGFKLMFSALQGQVR